jgi:hypothetical protein
MRHRIALLGCVLAVALSGATGARAEVTVLGLRSLEGDEALAERLTDFLRDFIARRGLDNVSDKTQTLEQMMLLTENCGEDVDPRCMREIADLLGADEVIYGFISRMPGDAGRFTYAVDVRRFSASSRRDVESASGTLDSTRQGTANLQILTSTLLDSLWGRQAPTTLIVQSNQPDAAVYMDGDLIGRTGAEPLWMDDVQPGEHEIRVLQDGFEPWERMVDVAAGQYRLLEAPLAGEDGSVAVGPDNPPIGPVGPPPPPPPPGGGEDDNGFWSDWRTWTGIAGIAVGVGLAGGGMGVSLMLDEINNDTDFVNYRASTPTGVDACSRAAADSGGGYIVQLCDDASTYRWLQWVLYGVGAAFAGVGIYFVVDSALDEREGSDSSDTAFTLTPFGLLGGGGLSLSGTF